MNIIGRSAVAALLLTTIAFEPQASIKGQSFYMEDNFVITRTGTELLTPGMPYPADVSGRRAAEPGRRPRADRRPAGPRS